MARAVARLGDRTLERAPLGPLFVAGLPLALRAGFRPQYAVDFDGSPFDATIQLTVVRGNGRRDSFDIVLRERRCRVHRHRPGARPPAGTLTIGLADLIRMATAAADPTVLAGEGRVEITGDTFLLVRFPAMFSQPTKGLA
jgi:hypothetical protein